MKPCRVDACSKNAFGRTYCDMHYRRIRLNGDPGPANSVYGTRMGLLPCAIDGCERKYYAKDLCSMHYNRQRLTGSAGGPEQIRQRVGSDKLWRWQDPVKGYVYLTFPGDRTRKILEHRHVMQQHLGRELTSDESVHHKNGNRSDNRIQNLELWSRFQPAGQRVEDKVTWAKEILARYADLDLPEAA